MPIAIASENSSASISGREKATLITKIDTVRTPATLTSRREKPRRPTWKAVSACRSERPAAMLPNAVAVPVATTTPRPAPWCTTVPMNAHAGRSSGESPAATTADPFSTGSDSPVSTASSHSSSRRVEQPQVGRHDVADAQGDDVARHELRDIDRDLRAVAPDQRLVVDVAVQRGDRVRRAVLVHEAQADAEHDDRGDDRGVGGIAGQAGHGRRREQQQEQRVAQLAHQHREGRDALHRERVGPERAKTAASVRFRGGPRCRAPWWAGCRASWSWRRHRRARRPAATLSIAVRPGAQPSGETHGERLRISRTPSGVSRARRHLLRWLGRGPALGGDIRGDPRPVPRRGLDGEDAAHERDALAHADQPEAGGDVGGREAPEAVVGDADVRTSRSSSRTETSTSGGARVLGPRS